MRVYNQPRMIEMVVNYRPGSVECSTICGKPMARNVVLPRQERSSQTGNHKRVTTENTEGHGKEKLIRILFSVYFSEFRG